MRVTTKEALAAAWIILMAGILAGLSLAAWLELLNK
jgi:hypothetical protein